MKQTVISYLKFAGAGLIASAADNLTYFIINHLGIADTWALLAARVISHIVNFFLLKTAVFQHSKRNDSFLRYILLVIFSTTIIYFLLQWVKPRLPGLDPVFIKMGLEFIMNFFNYAVSRFFVFDDRKAGQNHEA